MDGGREQRAGKTKKKVIKSSNTETVIFVGASLLLYTQHNTKNVKLMF